ncbi:copper chaperone PCu(A)C [Marinobacter nanhaiticus D15-8W]|uniref:Copper chaperone PCu(A)C n=1 Tax=Marinobacter nanhaiticus D15-8W TaxID=626887 RepID=N6WWU5_9GAMM|nr:copper chaperone PCu(A)C [Marinobacter nanhaiticus]ENO16086.2 copper chaperone PCu(A)C [Marinobacter nanhaiticus D15-8W]BES73057.1 copper chaperone PCu(A)C [Marinobacter nanhaiticus D15-8W]
MKAANCLVHIATLACVVLATSAALAQESPHHGIQVDHPWARPTPPVKPINGAAYFTIKNHGDKSVVLEGVSTPVTGMASIHRTREEAGTMRMDAVEGGLEIPAGGTVRFEPNGYHVMLMGLDEPLKEGESFSLTLEFVHRDDIELDVQIEHGPSSAPGGEMSGHHR